MTRMSMIAFGLALVFAAVAGALVPFEGPDELEWFTVDGGGATVAGGAWELSGTTGQPDPGVMSGGSFELTGGFWAGAGGVVTPTCEADCGNGDGVVDVSDLLAILGQWGGPGGCDLNDDGTIDVSDLLELLGAWGACP